MDLINRKVYLSKKLGFRDTSGDGVLDGIFYEPKDSIIQIPLIQKFEDIGVYGVYDEPEFEVFDISDVIENTIPSDTIGDIKPGEPIGPIDMGWDDGDFDSDGSANEIYVCSDTNSPFYQKVTEGIDEESGLLCYFVTNENFEFGDDEDSGSVDGTTKYCPKERYVLVQGDEFCTETNIQPPDCYNTDGDVIDCDDVNTDADAAQNEKSVLVRSMKYDEPQINYQSENSEVYLQLNQKCRGEYDSSCSRVLKETDIKEEDRLLASTTTLDLGSPKWFGVRQEVVPTPGFNQANKYRYKSFCYAQSDALFMGRPCQTRDNWVGQGGTCRELVDGVQTLSVVPGNGYITEQECPPD